MEQIPSTSSEPTAEPGKTGSDKTSEKPSKSKKSTIVPKSLFAESFGKEAETSRSRSHTRLPKGLFEPKTEKPEEKIEPAENVQSDTEEAVVDPVFDQEGGVVSEAQVSDTETEDLEVPASTAETPLETAPDAEPPFVLDPSELAEHTYKTEPVFHTESLPLPSEEAPAAAEEELATEKPVFPPVTAETPLEEPSSPTEEAPEVPEAVVAPVYYEDIPGEPPVAERMRMIDPSERYGEDAASEHHHASTVEPGISKEEHENAVYRAKKHATRRGLGAGMVVGWWAGRRGKKEAIERADKAEKETKKREGEIKQLQAEQSLVEERLRTVERSREQAPTADATREQYRNVPLQSAEIPVVNAPVAAETLSKLREKAVPKTPEHSEANSKKPETTPENQEISEDMYIAPKGRRFEMSAWHRVEVDERTGKPIENPSIEYGREFQNEQQQEKLHREAVEKQAAMSLGQIVSHATTGKASQSGSSVAPDQPVTPVPDNSMAPKPAILDTKFIKQQLIKRTTSPATWVIALIFVVLLFLLLNR